MFGFSLSVVKLYSLCSGVGRWILIKFCVVFGWCKKDLNIVLCGVEVVDIVMVFCYFLNLRWCDNNYD